MYAARNLEQPAIVHEKKKATTHAAFFSQTCLRIETAVFQALLLHSRTPLGAPHLGKGWQLPFVSSPETTRPRLGLSYKRWSCTPTDPRPPKLPFKCPLIPSGAGVKLFESMLYAFPCKGWAYAEHHGPPGKPKGCGITGWFRSRNWLSILPREKKRRVATGRFPKCQMCTGLFTCLSGCVVSGGS